MLSPLALAASAVTRPLLGPKLSRLLIGRGPSGDQAPPTGVAADAARPATRGVEVADGWSRATRNGLCLTVWRTVAVEDAQAGLGAAAAMVANTMVQAISLLRMPTPGNTLGRMLTIRDRYRCSGPARGPARDRRGRSVPRPRMPRPALSSSSHRADPSSSR